MKHETTQEQVSVSINELPVSARITVEKARGYGTVPGLEEAELADVQELERQVAWQMWGPVLELKPFGGVPGMAFTNGRCCEPDWQLIKPVMYRDPAQVLRRYQREARSTQEQLAEVVKRLDVAMAGIQTPAKYQVLKYVRMGLVRVNDVPDRNMRMAAKLYLEARKLREQLSRQARTEGV